MSINKSIDPALKSLFEVSQKEKIDTPWDRLQKMQPQCGFGDMGICCTICWQGPCRIDPFGTGASQGICGATADVIVARNIVRHQAAGAASHADHARHVTLLLADVAKKRLQAYSIKDEEKLHAVAKTLHISAEDKTTEELAAAVAETSLWNFMSQDHHEICSWIVNTLPSVRIDRLKALGLLPNNIDAAISNVMARTHMGCDADTINILLGGLRVSMADYCGLTIATEVSDILFGVPQPAITQANLGVLKPNAVNLALHGHNPQLSEVICDMAMQMENDAIAAGAADGINIVGMCCTGNEILNRRGVPLATNYLSQDMALLTGAIDAMVVDTQCIMPSVACVGACYHTDIITTMPDNKIAGAKHVPFTTDNALNSARDIVRMAIEAFKRRDPKRVRIPEYKQTAIVGFSAEAIIAALAKVNAEDPLKPLIDAIVAGSIQGIILFAGCNNVKVQHDGCYLKIAKELLKRNVLVLATGCGAGAFAKAGLMTQEATREYAGDALAGVLTAVGTAAGLKGPLPPVLHMGSCVDNSRAVKVAAALATKLGKDICDLPLVASAPEETSEKAISIGSWAVALGIPTHLGVTPQVTGSRLVTETLTESLADLTGGWFIVESDPAKAADKLFAVIQQRRSNLGI